MVAQKRYVDAIRGRTVTFGIGPAGAGNVPRDRARVAALSERQVGRMVLTVRPSRPAAARILPATCSPRSTRTCALFDGLFDTMDPERLNTYMERAR